MTPKGLPPRIGRGTIVEVRSGGWRVVQYDQGTGRATDSVRVARLVALVPAGAPPPLPGPPVPPPPPKEKPPNYQKITKLRVHSTARRELDRAKARAAPDEEGMKCQCWSRKKWDANVEKLLAGDIHSLPGRSGPLKCMSVGPSIREQKDRFMREKSIGVECDEQCLNRAQSIECTNENCGVNGGTCNNRQFHLGRSPKIDVRKKDGEWGLVAAEPLAKKPFIIECLGELVDREEAKDRFAKARDGYFMAVSSLGLVVDATKTGSAARFAKHSKEPNCVIETWKCGIDERYGLFALREIGENEELTYDHGWIRELRQPIKGGRAGPGRRRAARVGRARRRGHGRRRGEGSGGAARPFAEEEDEQYCDGCHAPVSDPAACKACKKKLCYACAKTTAEEYEEASPWYCPECNH